MKKLAATFMLVLSLSAAAAEPYNCGFGIGTLSEPLRQSIAWRWKQRMVRAAMAGERFQYQKKEIEEKIAQIEANPVPHPEKLTQLKADLLSCNENYERAEREYKALEKERNAELGVEKATEKAKEESARLIAQQKNEEEAALEAFMAGMTEEESAAAAPAAKPAPPAPSKAAPDELIDELNRRAPPGAEKIHARASLAEAAHYAASHGLQVWHLPHKAGVTPAPAAQAAASRESTPPASQAAPLGGMSRSPKSGADRPAPKLSGEAASKAADFAARHNLSNEQFAKLITHLEAANNGSKPAAAPAAPSAAAPVELIAKLNRIAPPGVARLKSNATLDEVANFAATYHLRVDAEISEAAPESGTTAPYRLSPRLRRALDEWAQSQGVPSLEVGATEDEVATWAALYRAPQWLSLDVFTPPAAATQSEKSEGRREPTADAQR